ncbi:hypothetical protein DRW03_36475 [Corallococcus sp. H22C18031201]|nr:hypothetical protein DRW03_36475 [Corallococcus sp. H22C18031201]
MYASRAPACGPPGGRNHDTPKATPRAPAKPRRAPVETLERIAREVLGIETLETRDSDRLDFHDVPVWTLKEALEAAYQAGMSAASSTPNT